MNSTTCHDEPLSTTMGGMTDQRADDRDEGMTKNYAGSWNWEREKLVQHILSPHPEVRSLPAEDVLLALTMGTLHAWHCQQHGMPVSGRHEIVAHGKDEMHWPSGMPAMKVYVLIGWSERSDAISSVHTTLQGAIAATPKDTKSKWLLGNAEEWDGVTEVDSLVYEGVSSWSGYYIEAHEVQG